MKTIFKLQSWLLIGILLTGGTGVPTVQAQSAPTCEIPVKIKTRTDDVSQEKYGFAEFGYEGVPYPTS